MVDPLCLCDFHISEGTGGKNTWGIWHMDTGAHGYAGVGNAVYDLVQGGCAGGEDHGRWENQYDVSESIFGIGCPPVNRV
jgi:hypothetical protein